MTSSTDHTHPTGGQPLAGGPWLAEDAAAQWHRRWLLVDADGQWLGAQQAPGLDGLQLQLRFGYLVLRAPGMLRLDVPLEVIEDDPSVECTVQVAGQAVRAVDEGDLAAAWLEAYLGQPARLVKVHPDAAPVSWP